METIKITFNDIIRELQYEVFNESNEAYESIWTEFYEGTETITKRKYWLFGKKMKVVIPKKIFEIHIDIRSTDYTKSDIKLKLLRKLELLERGAEIKRGEII